MKNQTENKNTDKREFNRFETNIQISLFYEDLVYSGIVSNLSKNGMFISTKRPLPVDTMLVTSLIVDDKPIKVPVRISRAVSSVNTFDALPSGVGVHVLHSSREYLDLLGKCRSQQLKLTL
jgi:Tfp pilus assembly protein PilZ